MVKGRIIEKTMATGAAKLLLWGFVMLCSTILSAKGTETPIDTAFYAHYPYIRFVSDADIAEMTDEQFHAIAAKVAFAINKAEPAAGSQILTELQGSVLPRINEDSLELAYMIVRGAASPDGPYANNKALGERRAKWLFDFIRQQLRFPVNEKKFRLDSEAEDYRTLAFLMRQANDKDYGFVKALCDSILPNGDVANLKSALQTTQDGQLWKRLNKEYFHHLRTARIVLFFKKYEGEKMEVAPIAQPIQVVERPKVEPTEPVMPVVEPIVPAEPPLADTLARREVLAIKTNVLFYGVYMPGYNRWCPIPNVAVEYYPKKGHFTFGASFDMPWWQDYDAHKYFQIRNYQLETRYYLKAHRPHESHETYETNRTNGTYKAPAYAGWYLQGYVHGGVFGICFDADRGWVGEGYGGGIGAGYVMPVSRNGHWRLEFGLQAGFFRCKYDPYQYENPVDPSYQDNLYYYKWNLEPSLFKKRQYRWNWIGPTRIGVTLSYDLLYKRIQKRGVSFKSYETNESHVTYESNRPYGPKEERRAEP